MQTFKHFTLILLGFFFVTELCAQDVSKNIVVEHFTNTRCSACASRNPNFYNALKQNPNVIHIAYHPSAPYSACLFSTQNKIQNDARPKYYGIFGSTPRFVINGTEKPGSQVVNSTVYNEFKNQTTPVDLHVKVAKSGTDDIEIAFDVDIKSNNTIGNVNYFVALVEDTVFYNAPNGEKIHKDVFRKSLSNETLPSFMIPQNAGNQYSFKDKIKTNTLWNLSRIYAIVVLTDSNKKVVQVARSPLYDPNIVSSTDTESIIAENVNIYPNPVTTELFFKSNQNQNIQKVVIINNMGQKLLEVVPGHDQSWINVSVLNAGTYFLEVSFENKISVQKFIKI
jgi:hypothetical protein